MNKLYIEHEFNCQCEYCGKNIHKNDTIIEDLGSFFCSKKCARNYLQERYLYEAKIQPKSFFMGFKYFI